MFLKKYNLPGLLAAAALITGMTQPVYSHPYNAVVIATVVRPGADTIVTDTLIKSCPKGMEVEKVIHDAIAMGAPIYNAGLPLGCYRIYEGAAYKILYVYGKDCKDIEKVLKAAVDKSHGDYSDVEKAWIMRQAFDKILGVPTQTKAVDNNDAPRREG